jgi:hypothetical protein
MTLGGAAAAGVRIIVWCKACQHQIEPDPAELAERYDVGVAVLDWRDRLVCSRCGSRDIDMVLNGGAPVIGGNRGHLISKTAANKSQMLADANSSVRHRYARVGRRASWPAMDSRCSSIRAKSVRA